MRLDKYLKVSRVIKRRTIANTACDNGRVTINGRIARASTAVKSGDIVGIAFGDKTFRFRILEVNEIAKKQDTSDMYEVLEGHDES